MSNLFKNLILILTLLLTMQGAFCYVLTKDELNKFLEIKLTKEVQKKLLLKQGEAEIKIEISDIPFNLIQTTGQSFPKIDVNQISVIQPNSFRRIIVKNPDNTIAKTFNITVKTSVLKEVLTAGENIPFNKEINSKNTKYLKKDVLKYFDKTISNLDNPLISKRNYQKGDIILSDFTKQKAEVIKNSLVDIVFLSNGIKIKVQGRALKDGNIGDTILVRSDKYNKVYNAKVNSSSEVVVRI